jgi:hypothetical protein
MSDRIQCPKCKTYPCQNRPGCAFDFSTTCARCNAPLEVTDATADEVAREHEERCLIPGDSVRWEFPSRSLWVEGLFLGSHDHDFWTEHRLLVSAASDGWDDDDPEDPDDVAPPVPGTERKFGTDNSSGTTLRRIPPVAHRDAGPDDLTRIRTPADDITVRADPTLKPGEWKLEQARATSVSFKATPIEVPARIVWSPRDDGFDQAQVDAAKAVLLSKVERKR